MNLTAPGVTPAIILLVVALIYLVLVTVKYRRQGFTSQQRTWLLVAGIFFVVSLFILFY